MINRERYSMRPCNKKGIHLFNFKIDKKECHNNYIQMEIFVLSLSQDKYFIGIHYRTNQIKSPGKDWYRPDNDVIDRYPPLNICQVEDYNISSLISIIQYYTSNYGRNNVFMDIDGEEDSQ